MLYVQESYVNATENYRFGESDVYESFTDSRGKLFRAMQNEFGRCTGRIYIDGENGTREVGWVFEKMMTYEDCPSVKYMREVWVTVHNESPTRTIQYNYA